jgi:hypothetical protein
MANHECEEGSPSGQEPTTTLAACYSDPDAVATEWEETRRVLGPANQSLRVRQRQVQLYPPPVLNRSIGEIASTHTLNRVEVRTGDAGLA